MVTSYMLMLNIYKNIATLQANGRKNILKDMNASKSDTSLSNLKRCNII